MTAYPWSKWRCSLGVELDLAVVVEAGGNAAIGRDGLDDGKVAIGDAERLVGRGELDAVADGELAVDLAVDADAGQAARIVGGKFAGWLFDGEQVGGGVDRRRPFRRLRLRFRRFCCRARSEPHRSIS